MLSQVEILKMILLVLNNNWNKDKMNNWLPQTFVKINNLFFIINWFINFKKMKKNSYLKFLLYISWFLLHIIWHISILFNTHENPSFSHNYLLHLYILVYIARLNIVKKSIQIKIPS